MKHNLTMMLKRKGDKWSGSVFRDGKFDDAFVNSNTDNLPILFMHLLPPNAVEDGETVTLEVKVYANPPSS